MNKALTESVTLNNGIKMPLLGLGVWQTKEGEEVENAVRWAIEAGYRSVDTAAVYQNEKGVGKAIKESGVPREEIFITTKVWNDDQGYESTLKAFEQSRKRLGTDIVDLYLIHWPISKTYRQTWKALVHLRNEGYVRAIGVSNFNIEQIKTITEDTGVCPAVNQIQLHPLNTQKKMLEFAGENNIKITAWRTILKGELDIPLLQTLAKKLNKTPAQIVLRWHIQNGVIVIPKSVHKERIIENSKIFDFNLSDDDMKAIDALNKDMFFGITPEEMDLRY